MESVSQELVCKAKAAEFLKEREILNDAAATAWCYDYAGITYNDYNNRMEFWCWTIRTYSEGREYAGAYIRESTDLYKKITDEIKTLWKDIKTEDDNENDTITALILGIMRIEWRGEMENNYLSIHEAIVSPEHYDIETKRSERLFKLGKEYTPKLEITIDNDELSLGDGTMGVSVRRFDDDPEDDPNELVNIRFVIHPPLFSYSPSKYTENDTDTDYIDHETEYAEQPTEDVM